MSLMFLISGIFVMTSLQKKTVPVFIRDRFYRLFIPFLAGVSLLMPLAYYPSYYLAHGNSSIKAYLIDFFTVEKWPVGPPWFIWLLFAFNLVFACCYPFVHKSIIKAGSVLAAQRQRSVMLCLAWFVFTWLLYVPAVLRVGPSAWTGIGPFDFQLSRLVLYAGYFLLGVIIGTPGLQAGLFATGSGWVKKWPFWLAGCIIAYAMLKLIEAPLTHKLQQQQISEFNAQLVYRSVWAASCTMSSIAFLTLFKQFFNQSKTWWQSLSANAYGIYLVHYIFVLRIQYYLLDTSLPALVKFFITFIVSLILSWLVTGLVRRNGLIKRYL